MYTGYTIKEGSRMPVPRWQSEGLDKDNLRRLYIAEGLTASKIATLTNHDEQTVRRYMRKYHINIRTHSETMTGRNSSLRTPGLTESVLKKLYGDEQLTTTEIAEQIGCNRNTVLQALKRYGIPLHTSRIRGLDEPTLRELYIDKRQSTIQIAKHFGCHDEAIRKSLLKHGIPVRTKSEALKNRVITPEHRSKLVTRMTELTKVQKGDNHPAWKGGKSINKDGYVVIRIGGKTILEHRYVMEQHLDRKLEPWEEVKHLGTGKPGNKENNDISNLEVFYNEHKHEDWLKLHDPYPQS